MIFVVKRGQALLKDETLQDVPVLVLGNKQDIHDAASEKALRQALGLQKTTGKEVTRRVDGQRPVEVFMCSLAFGATSYKDGRCLNAL